MPDLAFIGRILLAAALSAVIGIEREFHGRPAGLRTHLLVGSGAALVIVGLQVAWRMMAGPEFEQEHMTRELGRLAAGVITGIGFLGAGTILKVGDWVRGLTTAASLWFVAMLGLVAGLGAWHVALAGCAVGFTILAIIDPLAARIPSRIYQILHVTVEAGRQEEVQRELDACCFTERTRATLINWEWDSRTGLVELTYRVRHRGTPNLQRVAEHAASLKGVQETQIRL
ncbi:MAG TPA: MgtC/SapB family protein [Candidatus Acetothermia bacterium]|nr:MgtC/SapB family protein [Candidatus Acetothermia bacterium]